MRKSHGPIAVALLLAVACAPTTEVVNSWKDPNAGQVRFTKVLVACACKDAGTRRTVEDALAIFPQLDQLRSRRAGLISGGEQRMLVLARALAARPSVVLADEMSLGLAPLIVLRLLETLRAAADEGVGVLLVEQHARQALAAADRAYVLRRGTLVWEGSAAEARANINELEGAYLGE